MKLNSVACRICQGLSKTKCMFCGQKRPLKRDLTPMQRIQIDAREEEIKWLKGLFLKLRNLGMASTGSFTTDEKVRKEIGDWGDLSRATVTGVAGTLIELVLDSGMLLTIDCDYRDAIIGQRMTVRFLNGVPKL